MAKYYNVKNHEVYWSDSDIVCPLEDAWFELTDFLATKRLDGHDMQDQWYMLVERKMKELLEVLSSNPLDETDPAIHEIL